jgi:hypothetical protein
VIRQESMAVAAGIRISQRARRQRYGRLKCWRCSRVASNANTAARNPKVRVSQPMVSDSQVAWRTRASEVSETIYF